MRWWDHWLKGDDNGAMDEPKLRAWIQEPIVPAVRQVLRPGRWVAESEWPSARIAERRLHPCAAGGLTDEVPAAARRRHVGDPLCGSESGAWCPYGRPTDFPPDQRGEDGRSLTFTTEPLAEQIESSGARPSPWSCRSIGRSRSWRPGLCDVSPDGRSLLCPRGLLNLDPPRWSRPGADVEPGEPIVVTLALDFAGHRVPAGHRVRLSLSPTYWPFAWPSPEPVTLDVRLGERTFVTLPEARPCGRQTETPPRFPEPERATPAAGTTDVTEQRTLVDRPRPRRDPLDRCQRRAQPPGRLRPVVRRASAELARAARR